MERLVQWSRTVPGLQDIGEGGPTSPNSRHNRTDLDDAYSNATRAVRTQAWADFWTSLPSPMGSLAHYNANMHRFAHPHICTVSG